MAINWRMFVFFMVVVLVDLFDALGIEFKAGVEICTAFEPRRRGGTIVNGHAKTNHFGCAPPQLGVNVGGFFRVKG